MKNENYSMFAKAFQKFDRYAPIIMGLAIVIFVAVGLYSLFLKN